MVTRIPCHYIINYGDKRINNQLIVSKFCVCCCADGDTNVAEKSVNFLRIFFLNYYDNAHVCVTC